MTEMWKVTIAVVDDDSRVLESMGELLESVGYSVRAFSSAQALLEANVILTVDCIITDIGMPTIDGFELRARARELRPDLPMIFITGRHDPADLRRAEAGGHHGLFRKPFDARALLDAVDRAVHVDNTH
jgi:FixJ family two-component response regulator